MPPIAKLIKWNKDHLDQESEIVCDGKWDEDIEVVDNWPGEIEPKSPSKPEEEVNEWLLEIGPKCIWPNVIVGASSYQ